MKKTFKTVCAFLLVCVFSSTSFAQAEFHPDQADLFGVSSDSTPISSVDYDTTLTNENRIGLSFDSAYVNTYTYTILDVLDQYNVKATFFMTYEFMSENPDQVIEIVNRGHEIGNHSTTHPRFTEISDEKLVKEVADCHNFLKALTGVDMCLFRFPYGDYNSHAVSLVKTLGYYPIQWSFDSLDWKNESPEILLNRIYSSKNIKPGCICLFHNGATYTPEVLPLILQFFKNKNLVPCKISDLIYDHDFYLKNGVQVHR